jgi:hypothetical protein
MRLRRVRDRILRGVKSVGVVEERGAEPGEVRCLGVKKGMLGAGALRSWGAMFGGCGCGCGGV